MKQLAACTFAAVATLLLVAPPAAHAEDVAPAATAAEEAPAGRFTMVPADGGFVRLDTRTGIVSHCRRETGDAAAPWRCVAIPEDVMRTPDRLTALGEAVDALGQEVAALRSRLDAIERDQQARAAAEAAPDASSDAEMNRALDFSVELMRRFLGLVREMKRDGGEDRT